MQVSHAVKNYGRIKDIVQIQLMIAKECRKGRSQLDGSGLYSRQEIEYLSSVYTSLNAQSLKTLDALLDVVTAKKLRASDDHRLSAIDSIFEQASDQLVFFRHLNTGNSVLAAQRKQEAASLKTVQTFYDLQP